MPRSEAIQEQEMLPGLGYVQAWQSADGTRGHTVEQSRTPDLLAPLPALLQPLLVRLPVYDAFMMQFGPEQAQALLRELGMPPQTAWRWVRLAYESGKADMRLVFPSSYGCADIHGAGDLWRGGRPARAWDGYVVELFGMGTRQREGPTWVLWLDGRPFPIQLRQQIVRYRQSDVCVALHRHPVQCETITIQGLRPKTSMAEIRRAWGGLRILRRVNSLGRPRGSGTFASTDEVRAELLAAIHAVREQGRRPTQRVVADWLNAYTRLSGTSDRQIRAWLAAFGLTWDQLLLGDKS